MSKGSKESFKGIWTNNWRLLEVLESIKWRVGRKQLEEEKTCFEHLFPSNFLCLRGEKLWFKLGLSLSCEMIHFSWNMHEGNLKLIEWLFKFIKLCLNNIYKHDKWLGNDSIERMEEEKSIPYHGMSFGQKGKSKGVGILMKFL